MWKAVSITGWCLALLMTILWLRGNGEQPQQPQLEVLSQEQVVDRTVEAITRSFDAAIAEQVAKLQAATEQAADQQAAAQNTVSQAAAEHTANQQAAAKQVANQRSREATYLEKQVRVLSDRLDDAEAQVQELRTGERRPVRSVDYAEGLSEELARRWRDSAIGSFESLDGMVEQGSRQLVNSQYADLHRQLNLDDETMQEVDAIVAQAYTHMSMQGMEMLADISAQGIDFEMIAARQSQQMTEADYGQWLSEELSYILSPEDLAAFDQYQASLPGGMAGQQMDAQLAQFSAQLTEESRQTIRATLTDVMSSGTWLPTGGGEVDPGAFFDGAYQQARERLMPYLDDRQLAIYDRFAEQQLMGVRMAAEMMAEESGW